MLKKIFFIASIVILNSCTSTGVIPINTHIDFKSISKNSNSGFEVATEKVIQDKNSFENIWNVAWSRFSDPTPSPSINFENETVILIATGMRNNGGYQIKINTVHEQAKEIIVDYIETTPNPKCSQSQAITFPYEIISIPKTSKKILFKSSKEEGKCN